jgi:hypothetical protein
VSAPSVKRFGREEALLAMDECRSAGRGKGAMMKSKQIDLTAIVGRLGAEATLALHARKAGVMHDRRTRRNRTRADRKRRAIAED